MLSFCYLFVCDSRWLGEDNQQEGRWVSWFGIPFSCKLWLQFGKCFNALSLYLLFNMVYVFLRVSYLNLLSLQVISLGDIIKFSLSPSKTKDSLSTNVSGVPLDDRNLVLLFFLLTLFFFWSFICSDFTECFVEILF